MNFATPIVNGENYGFVFNVIWGPLKVEALRLNAQYTHESIDAACIDYLDMPYDVFVAMDMIGHNTLTDVFTSLVNVGCIPKVPSR